MSVERRAPPADTPRRKADTDEAETARCGYCHTYVVFQSTPRGRQWCPRCGAIPAPQQRVWAGSRIAELRGV